MYVVGNEFLMEESEGEGGEIIKKKSICGRERGSSKLIYSWERERDGRKIYNYGLED